MLVPQPYEVVKHVPYPVKVPVPQPYEVVKHVPYPVKVEVPVPAPYPVTKHVGVPVHVSFPILWALLKQETANHVINPNFIDK